MKDFNKAMDKLFSLVKDYCGCDDIRDTMFGWFWNSKTDKFEFDENGMFYLLYDLCNYDLIALNRKHKAISKTYSNHVDIAKLITPFVSKNNIVKVIDRLYK